MDEHKPFNMKISGKTYEVHERCLWEKATTKNKMFTNTVRKISDGQWYSNGHTHIEFGYVDLSL